MARMLPPEIPVDTVSAAEQLLFRRIRDELSSEWIALHSLGMTIHNAKPWAEIDFVLIGPPGVFCLEVKGGLVSRTNGLWYTTPQRGPNAGRAVRLKESPFEQVGSASSALFHVLEKACPKMGESITGYAIATPDVEWTISGPDTDPALVYDQRDSIRPFTEFMDRVERRWTDRIGRGWNRKLETLGRKDKQQVLESVRGDFHLVPSIQVTARTAVRELLRLTDEQCSLFARLAANPRVIASGGAGTGKTLIAVEEARRLAGEGNRVLYVCFSRNLASHVSTALADVPQVTVKTLHSLMRDVVSRAGRYSELPEVDENDLLSIFLPELALEVLLESVDDVPFDVALIDEGQDLLREPYLDVIEALIGGDLAKGCWRWFWDPNQNLFGGISPACLERLRGTGAVEWPLTVNCRNTAPIATQVALLSGVPLVEVLAPEGPAVHVDWYNSIDVERDSVSATLRQLQRDGFVPERTIILSRKRFEKSVAHGVAGEHLVDVSGGGWDSHTEGVAFSTVSSFKGLEADVVLLVDVDDLVSAEGLASVYVGASRASIALHIFASDDMRTRFEALAREFGQAAAGDQR
jgi:hypothetical protein